MFFCLFVLLLLNISPSSSSSSSFLSSSSLSLDNTSINTASLDLRSPSTDRAFFLFDKDGTGEIDFEEFVLAVWNFCTIEGDDLVRFCFNLYDLDGGGTLDEHELKELVQAVLGEKIDHDGKKATEFMTYLKLDDKGEANLKAFREFARIKGEALEPCYVLQRRLRARIVGEAFWRSLARKRKAMIKGELAKKQDKIQNLAAGARHHEDEDGGAFIQSGDDVEAARKAQKAKADAMLYKGSEMDRALARRVEVTRVRLDMDLTKDEWEEGAADENEGVGMLLAMEDPGATQRAEDTVLKSMNKEYFAALDVGANNDFRDFGVKRTKGGRNRMGRRRRRLSTAVRFKGERPKYLSALETDFVAKDQQEQPQTQNYWDEGGEDVEEEGAENGAANIDAEEWNEEEKYDY